MLLFITIPSQVLQSIRSFILRIKVIHKSKNFDRFKVFKPKISLTLTDTYLANISGQFACYSSVNNKNRSTACSHYNPILTYNNADLDKDRIIKENKGKSGIYR